MKILFTGSSSFTGAWFIRELALQGHQVTSLFQKTQDTYSGTRGQRVQIVCQHSRSLFSRSFGDESFLSLITQEGPWDLYCHHAADVSNYKSLDFDPLQALFNNTRNLKQVLESLKHAGCHKVLLTGTIFEQREGKGSEPLQAFSPYGLSKGLTSDMFRYYCQAAQMRLGKFVIPNPFGPYEEKRFTAFLMESWSRMAIPSVQFPEYVRDNIHVSLLAKAYATFAKQLDNSPGFEQVNPSGYVESQGDFALRFAKELSARLNIACPLDIQKQTEFLEPKMRVNQDRYNPLAIEWNESHAWDELALYYSEIYGLKNQREKITR